MATTATIVSLLRRRSVHLSSISFLSPTLSHPITSRHLITTSTIRTPHPQYLLNSLSAFTHSYSTPSSSFGDPVDGKLDLDDAPVNDSHVLNLGFDGDSKVELDRLSLGFDGTSQTLVDEVLNGGGAGEDSFFPIRVLISLLDGYHDFTGWPWWVIIASSTLALRIALFPLLTLQLRKLKMISELFPKLPPPFPPPLSGRSYVKQFSLFQKERRAIGCPSYLWFVASLSVQIPCFLLWMTSIRRMSLDKHPGFDCGGTLWFQNLTEIPHGTVGLILPMCIGSLHLINVQISFLGSSVGNDTGLIGMLAKYYKYYLYFLTLPIFFTGTCIPQGSLVYWVTNSSLSMIQQLCLKHPVVQEKLGLLPNAALIAAARSEKLNIRKETRWLDPQGKISAITLSPKELLAVAVKYLSDGNEDKAIPLLRLALDKDPDYVRGLIVMGQILLHKGMLVDAVEYLESAISKVYVEGNYTQGENCDLLILASQWAGVANIRQDKKKEGIIHLERIAGMEEPEDSKSKAHYFDGLLLLSSALYSEEGRKEEAIKHLRRAAAYDSSYNVYLQQCEHEEEDFTNHLVNSRRRDY